MQIKYATTIFSAVFLLLQVSIPMVDAIPVEQIDSSQGSGLKSAFKVDKRQTETPNQIIDQGFADYDTCVKSSSPFSEAKCFELSFGAIFVSSLTETVHNDNTDEAQGDFKNLVIDMVDNTEICVKNTSPENIDTDCLTEFHNLLVDVATANK
ncbi:hypothetical protein INT45_007898 [Circinella minor]|uniref:Uncharacterized protein n=1 Tax=Circinella minor TaxID=1195481 RepID=A0A8H7SAV4_9FUNG|nr:hypothetical protein INT45_007898 [Circinella minor]